MAIESAVMLRRVARIACLVLFVGLLLGSSAWAQLPITASAPVSVGSVIPFNHGNSGTWGQIYSMKVAPNGAIVFLDSAQSAIYQLAPGASVPTLVVGAEPKGTASDCSLLEYSSSYWNAAIAFDQWNNMYITDRYGSSVDFCRVPFDPSAGSWNFSNKAIWNTPTYVSGGQSSPIRPQDIQVGDDGFFYVSTSSAMSPSIFKFKVDQSGNVTSMTALATGLMDMISNIAVDHAGNLYFIENAYDQPSKKVNGILEIPAGSSPVVGDGTGSADRALPRLDSGWNGVKGLTFDAHGNLYFSSENNVSYGGQVDGIFMVPNEGTPTNPNLVWADLIRVSPISSGFPVMLDPRGMIWIATGGSSNWAPPGTNGGPCGAGIPVANCISSSMVLWKLGSASVGSSPTGTGTTQITAFSGGGTAANPVLTLTAVNSFSAGDVVTISAGSGDGLAALNGLSFYVLGGSGLSSTQFQITSSAVTNSGTSSATARSTFALYYSFSKETTPASIAVAKPSDKGFTIVPNPMNNTSTTPQVTPCTAGTTYPGAGPTETQAGSYSWCGVYVQLNTSTAGSVEGELQMLDSSNAVIPGSNAYLNGIGEGPAVSMVSTAAVQSVATGLNQPNQVAADAWGNSYVADSGLKAVEMYKAGATGSAVGAAIGTGLTAPTGVAVDRAGNVYIGDSGGVIEVPYLNGQLAASQQTTLVTGLGSHLNLAADASGNVFVADKDNKRVVEIPNPHTALLLDGNPLLTLGTSAGFTGPSAIATDNTGNVWVADGSNLWEITIPFGVASQVVKGLQGPITGLAVDPSGSVFVADASGLLWIPFNPATGSLNTNGQVLITAGLGASNASPPIGVALDAAQDAFVSYGSGGAAGMAQIGIGGDLNFNSFGEINPNVPFEADAQVFNLGNTALTLADFSGDVATDPQFTAGAATLNAPACGSGTNTPPGGYCYLGLTITATSAGTFSASMPVLSNAVNATTGVNIAMTANAVNDLRPSSSTSLTISPATGAIYPGTEQVTVTVTSQAGTPAGDVILSVSSTNGILPKQTQTLDASGTATFNFTNLLGGAYTVNALYGGAGTAGANQNSCSGGACFAGSAARGSFVVTPAQPTLTVGPPGNVNCMAWTSTDPCAVSPKNVTSWAGNTYVSVGQKLYITAQIDSSVGEPTGTITFCSSYANGKCTPADPTQGVNGALPVAPDASSGKLRVSFSTGNLPAGVYHMVAVYSGDVNYAGESIQMPAFDVIAPSVQITSTPATATITPGTPTNVTLTLMPLVGFSSAGVSVACSTPTLPKYTQCTFAYPNSSAGTVDVGSSSTTASTIVVTLSSNVPVNSGTTTTGSLARQAPWALAGLFGFGFLGLIAGRRKFNRYLSLVFVALMLSGILLGIPACTNAGYSTPPPAPKVTTPSGTYNVVIYTYNPNTGEQNSLAAPFTAYVLPTTVQ